ncbi:MAG: DEAD/DEAH box helicase, partial [Chloroflexota bacterium]|nr:DEAD/DEAH box helicase [Chloroflexota bacterium]
MKTSIQKLRNYFRLEAKRGYDNEAVMGGIENILSSWEGEARADNLPEPIIQAVTTRLRDYHRLSEESRKIVLQGLWNRIKRDPSIAAELENEADAPKTRPTPEPAPQQEAKRTAPPAKSTTAPPPEKTLLVESGPISPPQKALSSPSSPQPKMDLLASAAQLKGIGPKRAEDLERLGIITLRDLLYNFPRRHDDYSKLKPIKDLQYGESVTVIGTVKSASVRTVRSGKMKLAEAIISDKSGALRVTWFNQPWVARQLQQAKQVVLSGKTEQYLGRLTMNNPEWEPLDTTLLHTNRIVPVYSLTKEVGQRWMRSTMHKAAKKLAPQVNDPLPSEILEKADLSPLSMALQHIHFPKSIETLNAAKHRLAFDEVFILQLGVLRQKHFWQGKTGRVFKSPNYWLAAQLSRLPFALTNAQQKALSSIRKDLISGRPMNRLLQGDVGSGKTVVAAMAMLAIAHHGSQVAMMVPTSILAEQHYESMKHILIGPGSELSENEVCLLVGATPETEKQVIREGLEKG